MRGETGTPEIAIERKPGDLTPSPERYVDLSYYRQAMTLVGR